MALVAYDYDSTSGDEEEEENSNSSNTVIIFNKKLVPQINGETSNELIEKKYSLENNLFMTLPESKKAAKTIVEDQIEDFIPKPVLVKKEKQKVKITIPSLTQYEDLEDQEPGAKKIKILEKGSGLMSLLPPVIGSVKSATSFVPNVVANKTKMSVISAKYVVPNSVKKNVITHKPVKRQKEKKYALSDAESDDDMDIPETFDDEMWEKVCGRSKNKPVIQESEPPLQQEVLNIAPEPEKPYEGLDNKAFKELVGKSKRPIGNIKLIDINEEEILADKDLWLAKSLTDPEMAPKAVIEDPVDPTRRKKHHITYLAQQAKANEQDLKNSWAASKSNRMATRSKYGF